MTIKGLDKALKKLESKGDKNVKTILRQLQTNKTFVKLLKGLQDCPDLEVVVIVDEPPGFEDRFGLYIAPKLYLNPLKVKGQSIDVADTIIHEFLHAAVQNLNNCSELAKVFPKGLRTVGNDREYMKKLPRAPRKNDTSRIANKVRHQRKYLLENYSESPSKKGEFIDINKVAEKFIADILVDIMRKTEFCLPNTTTDNVRLPKDLRGGVNLAPVSKFKFGGFKGITGITYLAGPEGQNCWGEDTSDGRKYSLCDCSIVEVDFGTKIIRYFVLRGDHIRFDGSYLYIPVIYEKNFPF